MRRLQRDRQPLELGGNQLASLLLGLPELQRLELPEALRRRRLARARAERVELLEQRLVGEERRRLRCHEPEAHVARFGPLHQLLRLCTVADPHQRLGSEADQIEVLRVPRLHQREDGRGGILRTQPSQRVGSELPDQVGQEPRRPRQRIGVLVSEPLQQDLHGALIAQVAEHQRRFGVRARRRAVVLARPFEVRGVFVLRHADERRHRGGPELEERVRRLRQEAHALPLQHQRVLQGGDGRRISDVAERDHRLLDQERRRRRIVDQERQLGDGFLELHLAERLHGLEAHVVVLAARQPQQGGAGARVADLAERLRDAGVGAIRRAGGRVTARADGRIHRIEERGHFVGAADVAQRRRRLLADHDVLEQLGDLRGRLPRLELAQLLHGLLPRARIGVGQPLEPGARVFRIGRAAGEEEGEGADAKTHGRILRQGRAPSALTSVGSAGG